MFYLASKTVDFVEPGSAGCQVLGSETIDFIVPDFYLQENRIFKMSYLESF
jgi:hypothetical protein